MKKLIYLFTALLLSSFTVNAENIVESNDTQLTNYRNYGKSFIFVEDGIEFSIFPDGQFDFNIRKYTSNVNVSTVNGVSINYNSGYDYSAYLQYDEFGAIIQIENTYVDYDFYGRVNMIGDIRIRYDHENRITRIGGLNIYFNNYGRFDYCNGFINTYNRSYVYRSWHRFYVLPPVNYCVIYNQPYRQYYTPIRYRYDRPYTNNYRRSTAVASRRGNTITRNRSYASRTEGRTRVTSTPRTRTRSNNIASTTPRTRGNNTATPRTQTRSNTTTSLPRPRTNNTVKPRTRTQTRSNTTTSAPTRPRASSVNTPRTRTRTVQSSAPRTQKRVASTSRNTQSRTSKSSSRTTSNKRSSRR